MTFLVVRMLSRRCLWIFISVLSCANILHSLAAPINLFSLALRFPARCCLFVIACHCFHLYCSIVSAVRPWSLSLPWPSLAIRSSLSAIVSDASLPHDTVVRLDWSKRHTIAESVAARMDSKPEAHACHSSPFIANENKVIWIGKLILETFL